jgi:hypothetical protein
MSEQPTLTPRDGILSGIKSGGAKFLGFWAWEIHLLA